MVTRAEIPTNKAMIIRMRLTAAFNRNSSQDGRRGAQQAPPNESRLSCGALKKDSFHNLRAPSASSAG